MDPSLAPVKVEGVTKFANASLTTSAYTLDLSSLPSWSSDGLKVSLLDHWLLDFLGELEKRQPKHWLESSVLRCIDESRVGSPESLRGTDQRISILWWRSGTHVIYSPATFSMFSTRQQRHRCKLSKTNTAHSITVRIHPQQLSRPASHREGRKIRRDILIFPFFALQSNLKQRWDVIIEFSQALSSFGVSYQSFNMQWGHSYQQTVSPHGTF